VYSTQRTKYIELNLNIQPTTNNFENQTRPDVKPEPIPDETHQKIPEDFPDYTRSEFPQRATENRQIRQGNSTTDTHTRPTRPRTQMKSDTKTSRH
jgi:hypothetical protein